MYRSLNVETLGVTGRQSELIELVLSYRFKGLDIDIEAFARQVEKRGLEYAARCIDSARKSSAGLSMGAWKLPIRWQGPDDAFKEDLQKLPTLANTAKYIEATRCVTTVRPGDEERPLKENFDFHTARFTEIAELLAPHGIRLGIGFQAAEKAAEGLEHKFIDTAESLVTLIQMINSDQVGLHLDTWNWHFGGGTMELLDKLGGDKVVAVRAADAPADTSASSVELNQRLLPDPAGVVPNADILNKLHELGFDGPVTPYPHVSQYKGITRDKIVQKAADALRSVWPGIELQREAEAEAEEEARQEAAQGGSPAGDKKPAAKPEEKSDEKTNAKEQPEATAEA